MAAQLEFSSFSLSYSSHQPPALRSFWLDVPAGSCLGILGPTGAGKTTLLHCLAGILGRHHPEAVMGGHLRIGDKQYDRIPREILFPEVGLVLQDPYVQISGVRDNVIEEINFTLQNIGQMKDAGTRIHGLARDLGIEHLLQRTPTNLSGGETQRVALATILVARPSVLLLDEPVTALDATGQMKLRSILRSLRGKTTVLLTDTQLDFPLSVCDRLVMLDHGVIRYAGTARKLFTEMDDPGLVSRWHDWNKIVTELQTISHRHPREISRIFNALNLR
jgi:energy-coupling factor transport system ATP-binding protein